MLTSYRWPGNIRQLRNITEQISIIETSREITDATLRLYLPKVDMERLPSVSVNEKESSLYGSERELLYKVIFEMRNELNELKRIVYGEMRNLPAVTQNNNTAIVPASDSLSLRNDPYDYRSIDSYVEPEVTNVTPIQHVESAHISITAPMKSSHEYITETQSLEDMEKELIKQALIRNNGKRKKAADELKISERTLYRKIKEYDLE